MQIKTVSVHYERKVNLGDFNSAAVGCDLWADVTEEDDLAACMSAMWDMAKANVKAQLLPLTTKNEAKLQEIFMGLPVEVTGGK